MSKVSINLGRVLSPEFVEAFRSLSLKELPARAAYLVTSTAKAIAAAEKDAAEVKLSVFKRYGVEQGEGQWVLKADPDSRQAALKELTELAEQDVELPISDPIPLPDNTPITASHLVLLDGIVKIQGCE